MLTKTTMHSEPKRPEVKRKWSSWSFYVTDEMAEAAHRLSQREEEYSGRRVGAGVIIDRAMRRYVSEVMTPEEIAALASNDRPRS